MQSASTHAASRRIINNDTRGHRPETIENVELINKHGILKDTINESIVLFNTFSDIPMLATTSATSCGRSTRMWTTSSVHRHDAYDAQRSIVFALQFRDMLGDVRALSDVVVQCDTTRQYIAARSLTC